MRCRLSILALFLIGLLPALVLAQPVEVSRVLRTFDFEERALGNVEELPMNWAKVDGPGLPHYVNGRLTTERHRSGQYSFQFELNGGGLIYRYPAGLIRVQQGAHYSVQGYVQTTPLPNARARISAYLTDQDGHPIPSTLRHSALYAQPAGDVDWHPLALEVTAEAPNAAFLVIELGLLQPAHYASASLGERTLFNQDIHGSAWFDDITVSQVPQVAMTTSRPGNIFRHSDPLRLWVLVNDRFTEDLAAQLVVRDGPGRTVYQKSGAMDMAAAEDLGPGRRRLELLLPSTIGTGWYAASLEMTSHGRFVGTQTLNFVRLADDAPPALPDDRFGINAEELPFDGWAALPDLLPFLGAGRVKLAVWSKEGDVQQMDSDAFDHLLERLQERHITPTACLVDLPPDLSRRLNNGSWEQLLKADRSMWQPRLATLISRHAEHLERWQLGADGSDMFVQNRGMRQVYSMVFREFAGLVARPDLAMPWPAWYELEGEMPATIAVHLKPEVLPSQLPLYIADLKQREQVARGTHNLSIYLEPLDRARYGREVQIRDLAQRVAYALAADAERIDIKLPFTVQRVGGELMDQPDEMLLVARTLMTTLSGATFRGKVPIADGVEAFLFDKSGQGILMLWDRGAIGTNGSPGAVKRLALNLGQHPQSVDLWGNVTPLINPANDSDSKPSDGNSAGVHVQVGPMPIFLVDIDPYLAQIRASVAIDDPRIESSFKPHTRHLRFANPYRQAISGLVHLQPPAGWTLNPPSFTFSLNPGETFDKELTIEFPYNSFAGSKTIEARFNVQADTNNTFTVPVVLKLGLSDVGVQTLALRDGKDVIVQQMITNYSDTPINYTAFSIYPGCARQERLVTNLAPGRTTIKKYRFNDITFTPGGKVRSGIKETEGARVLNEEIAIQ